MRWFNVDGAREYLASRGPKPSRKVLYAMVSAGLRVSRISDNKEPTKDTRGRLRRGRMIFAAEWLDEFLLAQSAPKDERRDPVTSGTAARERAEVPTSVAPQTLTARSGPRAA